MLQYPYERFLRYLVSRKADLPKALEQLSLPKVGDLWILDTKAALRRDAPASVQSYLASKSSSVVFTDGFLEWAKTREIDLLWKDQPEFLTGKPDRVVLDALDLFCAPMTRTVIGMMLWARTPDDALISIFKERCKEELTPEALAVYRRLFCDVSSVDSAFWKTTLKEFPQEEGHYLAVGMDQPSTEQIRYIFGLDTQVTPERTDAIVLMHATRQFELMMQAPNPGMTDARAWGQLALQASKESKSSAPKQLPAETAESRFALFSVRVEKTHIPTLAELQGEVSPPPAPPKTAEKP